MASGSPSASASSGPPLPPVDNTKGAIWMVGSALVFAGVAVLIKKLGQSVPVAEMVFFRCLFGLSIIVPFIIRYGFRVFKTARPDLHIVRVLCAVVGMNCGFYAMTHMELATAVSLGYTRPLFMILLAVMFMGEVVRWRRGLATLIGFIGVLVMLQPATVPVGLPAVAALVSALAVAGAMSVVRQQAVVDGPATIMAWFATGTAIITAVPAVFVWETPAPDQWVYLIAIGVMASIGQYMMIKAFTHGEATVMNPIDYLQILLAALFGFMLFDEIPNIWTGIGAVVIIASTLYILLREAALQKPPPPPMKE
ncbi:MAG: DMT family transporter [Rhodospirillaceae bacterium]|nr:DMT family transporter [Rhodospirillaceae bacterium]